VSPGLTLPKAAMTVFPASQSTETVAALAIGAEMQKPARTAALPAKVRIAVMFICGSYP